MFDRVVRRVGDVLRRLRRIERRELVELRRWMENTSNLVHLSVLVFVPLLIALVTHLSNLTALSFLLFPPLASGTYTLFADPEGQYADPIRFVAGFAAGAAAGWLAEAVAVTLFGPVGSTTVSPVSAALAIFFAGAVTWGLDVEEPAAYSTALLVLVAVDAEPWEYLLAVVGLSSVVAFVFVLWRSRFYERRAQYLYGTTRGDDHVLVPMRGETATKTALFAARLAAAHEAGKVVLLDVLDDPEHAAAERAILDDELSAATSGVSADTDMAAKSESRRSDSVDPEPAEAVDDETAEAVDDAADRLQTEAQRIRTRIGVPCEVVVASGSPGTVAVRAARETNCDLVVVPFESENGHLSGVVRTIFNGPTDAVAFRSRTGKERWRRILVAVSRPGDSAHAMIDFAERLAGRGGHVSICTCISTETERRTAENKLAKLVETTRGHVETRVARADIKSFIAANAEAYDLVVIGSSGDRSAASRFISPPTFERLESLDCDLAVVDRGRAN
ncbi:universal stress protein UspA [Haloprofundus marisrubri]|uniref:Universal stress protein UspA n=1 Tax=Haloprofundus marisrubri TaxID=1514971 RepID=A0A0W1R6R5_9EURY|nr:universal stress protein [Haloprofundus marisrubri]KTG09222.1 universal stress protein UspA [Haloprofundus marisrubri]